MINTTRWSRPWLAVAVIATSLLAGCSKPAHHDADSNANNGIGTTAQFKILAGSELKDFGQTMTDKAKAAGVEIKFTYAGTLDIVDRVNAGEQFDAILPPNGAYPALALKPKIIASDKLFYSRIAIGIRAAKLHALGWDQHNPTWADIAEAANQGKLTYAMTNPTSSNSGMSALFAVAAAGAGKTEDLASSEVNSALLTRFLKGQQLTAGSSGWLADAFVTSGQKLDAMINYEAVLLRANDRLTGPDKLTLIYPTDGVITANYPLMLLNAAKRSDYDRLIAAWKSPDLQQQATQAMNLRPVLSDVAPTAALPKQSVVDLTFPNRLDVIDKVLSAYQGELRRPATSIFVLDVSGSMQGDRLAAVQNALRVLTGADATTATARYASFQKREHVQLMAFSDHIQTPVEVNFDQNLEQGRNQINQYANHLVADGGTAIYGALAQAEIMARTEHAAHPERLISIVLLTDGENNIAPDAQGFTAQLEQIAGVTTPSAIAGAAPARIFPIIFGEASDSELGKIATLTGGKLFDGRQAPLPVVFKEIRGYQ